MNRSSNNALFGLSKPCVGQGGMDFFGGRRKRGMGITEDLRWVAAKLTKLGKSAIDSAVYESLNGGMRVYTTVKKSLQDEFSSQHHYGDKNPSFVVVEQMKAKQEKMQKDMNSIKQQKSVPIPRTKEQEIQEQFSDESLKCSTPEVTCRKKIFIRSRL